GSRDRCVGEWAAGLWFDRAEDGIGTRAHKEGEGVAHQEARRSSVASAKGWGAVGSHRVGSRRVQVLRDGAGEVFGPGDIIVVAVAIEAEDPGAGLIEAATALIDVLIIVNSQPVQRAVVERPSLA